jgi:predicted PurR-regulated permease PerM
MNETTNRESFLPPLWVLTLIGISLVFWALIELKEIVVLLVVGYSIAYVIDPILEYLEKRKISRSVGVFLVVGILLIFILLLVLTAAPTVAREYEKLSANFPNYLEKAKSTILPIIEKAKASLPEKYRSVEPSSENLLDSLSFVNSGTINGVLTGVLGALLKGYSITLTLANLVLLPFIVFYIAVDLDKIHKYFLFIFPRRIRIPARNIIREIDTYVSAFVRGQLLVCTCLFVLYAIGLSIVGVDLWLLLAVIAGFGNMIPYFGFLCGIVLSSLMALVTFGTLTGLIGVVIVFAIVQFLEGFVITPKIIGGKVGLSPLVIILAIFAGGQIFGLLGIFLAIPGAAVLRVIFKHLHLWVLEKSEA